MRHSLLRYIGMLLLSAQLVVAWAPVCAFACANETAMATLQQSDAADSESAASCSCGMQALCQAAFAPALLHDAAPLRAVDLVLAPDAAFATPLTRYIAPLPEPPVA